MLGRFRETHYALFHLSSPLTDRDKRFTEERGDENDRGTRAESAILSFAELRPGKCKQAAQLGGRGRISVALSSLSRGGIANSRLHIDGGTVRNGKLIRRERARVLDMGTRARLPLS